MKEYRCLHCKKHFERDDVYKNYVTSSGTVLYMCRICNTARIKLYRNTEKGRENINRAVKKSIKKHSIKQSARLILKRNLQAGNITRKVICESCNEMFDKLEGHHEDYSKPLEVIWLCKSCHRKADRILRLK